ncbi:MAG TPA: alkaline phosphatase D family protein [Gemmatimonadales bacterium]|nr:alkaline phosphatase D family protein [Gemmatimonadales bacterium]
MRTFSRCLALGALLAVPAPIAAQAPPLQAGPMTGYSEMREALLWVQTTRPARVRFEYWDSLAPGTRLSTAEVTTSAAAAHTARLLADRVEPGRTYHYRLLLDGAVVPLDRPLRFRTQALWQWRTDPPSFRIALGSCFYVNQPPYDRPGDPYGGDFQVLGALGRARPDAMLWLGDNTYLREADWYSRTGILARYTHTRSFPALQPLLGAMHHYATWDDHDYGPDDADRGYRDKRLTREAFGLFWGNPAAVLGEEEGVTTMFQWGDVDFFLLDDRWWRAPDERRSGERTMLGEAQREWLVDALVASRAPFKVVVLGGQVLNPSARFESLARFPADRDWLLARLAEERVPGVFFVSGDIHHTELTRLDRPGTYPLHDLSVSPLTAGISRVRADDGNTLRVPGTVVEERNFATLDFSGPRTDRQMVITVWNADGVKRWERVVKASELR